MKKYTMKNFFLFKIFKYIENIKLDKYFKKDFQEFSMLLSKTDKRFSLNWNDRYPCLKDNTQKTEFDRHYLYHMAWAARILAEIKPELHIDISSNLYFSSIISAFIPVKFYDYRPADIKLNNLSSESADLLKLKFEDKSINCLSCMHVVEHVGLGRYGDNIDPDGDLKAISELKRVLAVNGSLLFVVPVGKPRIMFNAHRIYSYEQVISYFLDFDLKEFSLIPDNGNLIHNASKEITDKQFYGCGCFWFTRKN